MMIYEQVVEYNHRLIRGEGEAITTADKDRFTAAVQEHYHSSDAAIVSEKKKLRLVTGELPKSILLSRAACELETFRLVALWKPGQGGPVSIWRITAQRLEQALSSPSAAGEYFSLRLVFLRYWHAWQPVDDDKINAMLSEFSPFCCSPEGMVAAKKAKLPIFYMWLVLSELAQKYELARDMIRSNNERLSHQFQQGWIVNPLNADWYNPIRKHVIQAALTQLPEYQELVGASVLIRPDGRCYGVFSPVME